MEMIEEQINKVAQLIVNAKKIIIFTGAGVTHRVGHPRLQGPMACGAIRSGRFYH